VVGGAFTAALAVLIGRIAIGCLLVFGAGARQRTVCPVEPARASRLP
jgi:hypothetical protein